MKTIIEQIIKKQLRQAWENDLRDYALKCPADDYLSYDLHNNYPSFVFVAADVEQMREMILRKSEDHLQYIEVDYKRVCIKPDLDPDEELKNMMKFRPIPSERFAFLSTDVKHNGGSRLATDVVWHVIRPGFKNIVRDFLFRRRPDCEVLNGVQGWIVPLYATSLFEEAPDLNEYMHNLMFWESVMTMDDFGPMVQRYTWLLNTSLELVGNEEQLKQKVWSLYPESRNMKMDNVMKALDVVLKKKLEADKEQERKAQILEAATNERDNRIQQLMMTLGNMQKSISQLTQERAQSEVMVSQYNSRLKVQTAQLEEMRRMQDDIQQQINNLIRENENGK